MASKHTHFILSEDVHALVEAEMLARRAEVAKASRLRASDIERVVNRSAVIDDILRTALTAQKAA